MSPNSYSPNQGLCDCKSSATRCSDRMEEKDVFHFKGSSERRGGLSGEYLLVPANHPNPTTRTKQVLLFLGLATLSLLYLCTRFFGSLSFTACKLSTAWTGHSHTPAAVSLLEVFQVYQPVLAPSLRPSDASRESATDPASDGSDCLHTSILMDHVFAFSYGDPFVG
jgi:hypothetical protein